MTTGGGIFDFFRETGGGDFFDIFEDEREGRRIGFLGAASQTGPQTKKRKSVFDRIFQEVDDLFRAELGSQILRGDAPTLKFADVLSQFPISKRIQAVTGANTFQDDDFAPRTRSIFFN